VTTKIDDQPLDFVIVGQGLAGTTLAWQLKWRGLRGVIVDRDDGTSASKVAAGLMTPVTGKRLVPAWRLDESWAAAEEFYRRVEEATNSRFLSQPGQVRLFESEESKAEFDRRGVYRCTVGRFRIANGQTTECTCLSESFTTSIRGG
jgi:glycine oxidase